MRRARAAFAQQPRPTGPLTAVFLGGVWLCATVARAEDPVAVLVTGPLSARVGDRVSFEVELVNRSGRALEKLRVIDYFDKGFHHDASASPIEQKGTVDLAAGTARRLTLDFLLDEPGRQCHRVEILDQAHVFVGGATSCVEVAPAVAAAPLQASAPTSAPVAAAPATVQPGATVPPAAVFVPTPPVAVSQAPLAAAPPTTPAMPALPATSSVPAAGAPARAPALELDMAGPAEVTAGGLAEFFATVRNTGQVASGPTTLEFSWEDAFTPTDASEGYKLASSRVTWDLPTIEPGAQMRRQINLRAQAATATGRSCVRSVLSGAAGGMMVADESCVLIHSNAPRARLARESGLRLSLADCDDPVVAGQSTNLVCTIVNAGSMASGRLDLTILLPERAIPVGDPKPSRVRIDGANVTFDSIPSIAPGGQSQVEVAYRIPGSGTGKASAFLKGAELEGSIESSCQTTFLAP